MRRIAKLLTNVALLQMILAALQNTLEARRASLQESRRVKIAENKAKRNWQAWQQARAEAEHWQQAAERAEQERLSWQAARDEALTLQQARAHARQRQRDATATVENGARATAEWLQNTADETQQVASHGWRKIWAALILADRMGGAALDGVQHGLMDAGQSMAKSRRVQAARRSLMQMWAQRGWGQARARRLARQRRTQRLNAVAIGAGVGAVAWYFLDPATGSQRRAQFRDRVLGSVREAPAGLGNATAGMPPARDFSAPIAASGMAANPFSDLHRGGAMAGSGSFASGLTGGASGPAPGEASWPLGVRVLAGLAGGVLMVTGLGFRGAPGIGGRAVGVGLLARALTNMPFSRLARRGNGAPESAFTGAPFPRMHSVGEIQIGQGAAVPGSASSQANPAIDIVNPAHSDLRTGSLGTLESQTDLSGSAVETTGRMSTPDAAETMGLTGAAPMGGVMPGSNEAARAEAEAAVSQIEAAAEPAEAARGLDLDEHAGEREIPLGQWQAFFDELGREYGERLIAVERANGERIAEQPLLGASVNLRPDGRDVRLLLGTNLGAHMDHLVENVRSLIVLPGRSGQRGFRLEAADGATTVRPLSE